MMFWELAVRTEQIKSRMRAGQTAILGEDGGIGLYSFVGDGLGEILRSRSRARNIGYPCRNLLVNRSFDGGPSNPLRCAGFGRGGVSSVRRGTQIGRVDGLVRDALLMGDTRDADSICLGGRSIDGGRLRICAEAAGYK